MDEPKHSDQTPIEPGQRDKTAAISLTVSIVSAVLSIVATATGVLVYLNQRDVNSITAERNKQRYSDRIIWKRSTDKLASTAAAISSLTCWDAVGAVSNMDAAVC